MIGVSTLTKKLRRQREPAQAQESLEPLYHGTTILTEAQAVQVQAMSVSMKHTMKARAMSGEGARLPTSHKVRRNASNLKC